MVKTGFQSNAIVFKNDVHEVAQLDAFVRGTCAAVHMEEATAVNVGLAVEEAVVNVMRYAYPEGTKGEIRVTASVCDGKLTFQISDDGKPFDPTAAEGPDITLSAQQRPIGGLGIFLMRQYMDAMSYKRMNDCNILFLAKNLEKS
ncbi:MAG: ATP-binding protein [Bacteroidaceae bacterium]|nr:ATP-binding protein [Bacteroidaceae bacterium]